MLQVNELDSARQKLQQFEITTKESKQKYEAAIESASKTNGAKRTIIFVRRCLCFLFWLLEVGGARPMVMLTS